MISQGDFAKKHHKSGRLYIFKFYVIVFILVIWTNRIS